MIKQLLIATLLTTFAVVFFGGCSAVDKDQPMSGKTIEQVQE
jgi:hypothetical protein